jgi:predicted DsbA family dithiol-disulfide isomerase
MNDIRIDLWTSQQCGWCPLAKTVAKRLLKKFPNLTLAIRTVEDEEAEAKQAGLSTVPTWILTNGRKTRRIAGVGSLEQLSKAISSIAV